MFGAAKNEVGLERSQVRKQRRLVPTHHPGHVRPQFPCSHRIQSQKGEPPPIRAKYPRQYISRHANVKYHTPLLDRGEIRRLLNTVIHHENPVSHVLHWSNWRREHQNQARLAHTSSGRLRLQTLMMSPVVKPDAKSTGRTTSVSGHPRGQCPLLGRLPPRWPAVMLDPHRSPGPAVPPGSCSSSAAIRSSVGGSCLSGVCTAMCRSLETKATDSTWAAGIVPIHSGHTVCARAVKKLRTQGPPTASGIPTTTTCTADHQGRPAPLGAVTTHLLAGTEHGEDQGAGQHQSDQVRQETRQRTQCQRNRPRLAKAHTNDRQCDQRDRADRRRLGGKRDRAEAGSDSDQVSQTGEVRPLI